jgi:hypothetical protein
MWWNSFNIYLNVSCEFDEFQWKGYLSMNCQATASWGQLLDQGSALVWNKIIHKTKYFKWQSWSKSAF